MNRKKIKKKNKKNTSHKKHMDIFTVTSLLNKKRSPTSTIIITHAALKRA